MRSLKRLASSKVLQLLSCLYEEVTPRWNRYSDPLASVTCPNMKTRITRTTMDGPRTNFWHIKILPRCIYSQEVEIRMKPCKNGIFLSVFVEIRSGRSQQVRSTSDQYVSEPASEFLPVATSFFESATIKTQANRSHLGNAFYTICGCS